MYLTTVKLVLRKSFDLNYLWQSSSRVRSESLMLRSKAGVRVGLEVGIDQVRDLPRMPVQLQMISLTAPSAR